MSREGRFNMKELVISQIAPNRKRNFDVHPINKDVVESLMASYEKTGDFGVIPVREIAPGKYEQACGHHRIEAMKRLGHIRVSVKIAHFSDEEMRNIMINENATQQGNNPAAMADSVLAIATDLAYAVFICDSAEKVAEISATFSAALSHRQSLFGQVKTSLNKGGISEDAICVCMGGKWRENGHAAKGDSPIARDAISSSLAALRADNTLQKEIFKQRDRADRKLAAEAKEEKERIEKSKRAAEEAERKQNEAERARVLFEEEQERQRIARENRLAEQRRHEAIAAKTDAKKAEKAAAKAAAAKAEADAAQARADEFAAKVKADEMRRAAEARAEERARLDKLNADAEAKQKKESEQRKKEALMREAAKKKADEERYLAAGLQTRFNNNAQFDAYRSVIRKSPQFFPIDEQHALIDKMLKTLSSAQSEEQSATAKGIRNYLHEIVCEKDNLVKELFDREEARRQAEEEALSLARKAKRIHDEMDGQIARFNACLVEFDDNMNDHKFLEEFLSIPHSRNLYGNFVLLERVLPKVRKALGVASRSITEHTTVDNVVNIQ